MGVRASPYEFEGYTVRPVTCNRHSFQSTQPYSTEQRGDGKHTILNVVGDSIRWLYITEGEGDKMKVSFAFIGRGSPLSKHKLSVSPMFKGMHFSCFVASKHQPTALSGAQPKEPRSRLALAVWSLPCASLET